MKDQGNQFETWFSDAEDATTDARAEAERARDYVDGIQLTSEEITELKERGQPPVVINRIRRKIEWLRGLEVKQRTDPKAFPRTPQHQEDAESVTDAIRYVCDNQDWDGIRSDVYSDFLVEGFGGCEVTHKQNRKGEVDIVINHYPWDRLFYDPFSRKDDFSDARYLGVVLWMDGADFARDYPDHADHAAQMAADFASDTYDDRPNNKWYDGKRNRVRLVLMWHRKAGVWHWVKFVRGAEIESGESPYQDDEGESLCPLVLQSAYVGRDNSRYGIVRDMFDPQDEVNKRRSKALHTSTSRQTYGIKGAVDSVANMKRQLALPDGHVEMNIEAFEDAARVGMKPFDILPQGDQLSAQFSLLQEAKNEIDLLGANSALEGEVGESTSGRAVLARQQGGMIEIASLNDKLHRFTRTIYRQIWFRIKQFWNTERWVRVTDEESTARFVGVNQPITMGQKFQELAQEEGGEQKVAMIAQRLMLQPGDPRLEQVVEVRNDVSQIDVDIILEEVPDRVTLEGEVFEALLKYGPQIPPAVLIEADPTLPSKKKEKLLELMQAPPPPSPEQQLDLAAKEAGVMETQAKTQKLQVEAQQAAGMPLARYT